MTKHIKGNSLCGVASDWKKLYIVHSFYSQMATFINSTLINNTTAAPATITIGIVSSGGTLGPANEIMTNVSIPAGPQGLSDLKTYMPAGASIMALQGTAGAITLTISGTEVQ